MRRSLFAKLVWAVVASMPAALFAALALQAAPVEITWVYSRSADSIGLKELLAAFAKVEPDIKVNYVQGDEQKCLVMVAGGVAPDICRINDDYVVDYVLKGYGLPLDAYIKADPPVGPDDYVPFFWSWPVINGHHYAWIMGVAPRLLFVNEDLFKQAGVSLPPTGWESPEWNWNTFLAAAKKLTRDTDNNGRPDVFGASIFHDTGFEQTFSVDNGGPGIYSPDGRRFTLADPKGLEAMQWVTDLALKEHVQPTPSEASSLGGPASMFSHGKLGMFFADIRGNVDDFRGEIKDAFDWAVRPVPMNVRGIQEGSYESFLLMKGAKHPLEAYKFMRFMASEAAQAIWAEHGTSVGLKPEWVRKYFLRPNLMPHDQEVIVTALDHYRPVNKAVGVQAARAIYRPALTEAFNGKRSVQDALISSRPAVEKLLAAFPDATW